MKTSILLLLLSVFSLSQQPPDHRQLDQRQLVFENDLVRVYRGEIPAQAKEAEHRHSFDDIRLSLDDGSLQDAHGMKKKFSGSEVVFEPNGGGATHAWQNVGKDAYRYLEVELRQSEFCPDWQKSQQQEAFANYQLAMRRQFQGTAGLNHENGFVFHDVYTRADDEKMPFHRGPYLLVAVTKTSLLVDGKRVDLQPGASQWFAAPAKLARAGSGWYHFFTVEFTPSSCPQPRSVAAK